ncbi:hypothetical protein PRK78_000873 [Emydomyces testavorans]|uniref:Uncharacterized protein n=1 Tax=Emydomyces testavorans TaxID=2070801 RepID=A0AAF0DBF6_9EURO|nr:hypothetical protein PRK78_000873 [Emydomyces testavorans]
MAVQSVQDGKNENPKPNAKWLCGKFCEKIKIQLKKLHPQQSYNSTDSPHKQTFSHASDDEWNSAAVLRRRTFEGINLTYPKVQALTGNGKVPRKPSLMQQELSETLLKENRHRRRSTLSARDYRTFINTGELDETLDETDELIYNSRQFEPDKSHIEELLSGLSSEPPDSIRMPFSVETDKQEDCVSHESPSAGPPLRRISNFFETLRSSSPFSAVDSGEPKITTSPKGKDRVVQSPSPPDGGSSISSERRPASPYRLGRARREGCADFDRLGEQ